MKESRHSKNSLDSFDSFERDVPTTFRPDYEPNVTERETPLNYEPTSFDQPVEQTDAYAEDPDPLEFPADNIEILEELGEGVFGSVRHTHYAASLTTTLYQVYLAEATGIIDGEDVTEVVVKVW